jgi:hypothetical protein
VRQVAPFRQPFGSAAELYVTGASTGDLVAGVCKDCLFNGVTMTLRTAKIDEDTAQWLWGSVSALPPSFRSARSFTLSRLSGPQRRRHMTLQAGISNASVRGE